MLTVRQNPCVTRGVIAVGVIVFVGGASAGSAGVALQGKSALCSAAKEAGVATVAYLRDSDLHALELASCRDRVLARKAAPPVRLSADGRWVAFGRARVVSVAGGPVLHPVSKAAYAWAWSPRGERLAVVTRRGGVVLTGPQGKVRRVTADGWGAQEVAFAPDGSLAATRALFSRKRRRWVHQEVWGFLGPNLTPNQLLSTSIGGEHATPQLVTWSPDGRWIFFLLDPFNSASLAADGLPLYVKGPALGALGPRIASAVLAYEDYLSWCGNRLVVAAGGDRYATHGKHLIVASPPGPASGQLWTTRPLSRDSRLSWVSPACSPDGRYVAAAAGPNRIERRFGQERRSIWLLARDCSSRRKLTTPPPGASDELPRWSRDGRLVFFIRSGKVGRDTTVEGTLFLLRVGDRRLLGPLVEVGPTWNYYGHYDWVDWVDLASTGGRR